VPNAVIMAVCIWMLARSKASLKAKKICALIIYYVGLLCDVETSFNLATDSHFYMAILSYSPITAIIQSYAIEKMYISHTLLCGQALYFSLRLAFSKVTIPEEIAFFFAVFISHVCIGLASYIVILERTIKNNFNTEINETLDGWKETMNICPIGFLIMVENQAVYSNIEMGHIFNSFKTQESSSYLSILQMLEKIAKPMNSIGIHGIEIKIINLESKIFEWRKKKVFYKLKEAEMHVLIDVTAASNREKMSTQKKYVEMLVATSTHELRTPLNGIKSFLTITKSHCTPEGLSYISKALSACELQESLINDIMDFAKIQGDNVIINNDQINSHQLLHDCYNILEFQTKEKSLQFDLNINPSVPVIFNSDGRRIKQILLNLLSNALKFTSNGYIKLKAKKKGNMIGFSVKDSGIGIKEEDIGKLFKPSWGANFWNWH
jgi:nitrogen-specific signal transduction histidine kinase